MGKGTPPRRRPFGLGGTEIVVALDDDVYDLASERLPTELLGRPILVVRARDLEDPERQADLYYGAYRPTTPTCRQVVTFIQGGRFALLEQDGATGSVYRAGELVWATAPVAVWNARTGTSELEPQSDGALLFLDGPRVRITTIPDVFAVHEPFRTRLLRRDERIPPDWTERARAALAG